MYLISPNKKQFKANLHCHSVISDGKLTPERLKEVYKEQGYSVLAITDHEVPCSHQELSDSEFLMITGYETYIRPNPDCRYDKYNYETHLNLFAREPQNETVICFNPKCCKYISEEQKNALKKAGSQRPREYTVEYINEYIKTAKDNGYIVAQNHPYWSMESEEVILGLEGCFSMEMVNYGSYVSNGLEYNGRVYDKMLMKGKRIFCHSADDNHNGAPLDSVYSDSFGGITMILAENLEYGEIFSAMEKGEMYSTMGPTFKEVSFDGEKLHIECSDVQSIYVYYGSKAPSRIHAPKGGTVNCADITVDKNCKYIRVSIADKYGNRADTRGFFRDELGL